jgi:hypothetical protein
MATRCGHRVLLCAALAIASAAAAGAGPARSLAVGASSSCRITQSHSLEGKVKTTIRFVNRSTGAVKVYWLDYAGKQVYYTTLAAGASYAQPTWVTHPWVVLDGSGACIGYVVAPAAEYVIGGSGSSGGARPAALKPTFTAVVCTIAAGAGSSTCTAQVADAGPVRSSPPTGTATFTAARGIIGKSCTLAGTPGSPGIAACTVSYTPPSNLVQGEPPPVTAEYSGDPAFSGSSGGSGYTPASVLGPSTVTATGDGGIPTDLVNPNPFPVSADEALTVQGTATVMLRGSPAAKPKVIGRTTIQLRPFASVARTIPLTAAGRSLLAGRKTLTAVLTVTTRAHGKPTKHTTRRLVLRAR